MRSNQRKSLFSLLLEVAFRPGRGAVVVGTVVSCGHRNRKWHVYIPMAQETGQEVGLGFKPQGPPP